MAKTKQTKADKAAKIQTALNSILTAFKSGNLPKALSFALLPNPDTPMSKWSARNRLLAILANTQDGRTFKQWKQAGRNVKKGAKAFYILRPILVPSREGKQKQAEGQPLADEDLKVIGYRTIPEFRLEDTEGQPLPEYEGTRLIDAFPLIEVANTWGVSIIPVSIQNNPTWGRCISEKDEKTGEFTPKQIELAANEETVFFHELAHAAHRKLNLKTDKKIPAQFERINNEIIAELSAQTLAHLVGREPGKHLGTGHDYIKAWSPDKEPLKACLALVGQVTKVVEFIIKTSESVKTSSLAQAA